MKISSIQANEAMLSYDTPLKMVLPFDLKQKSFVNATIKQNKQHHICTQVNEFISSTTILTHFL